MNPGIVERLADERVAAIGESQIGNGVEGPQVAHVDRIAYFCLLGILGLNHLVGHVAVEITVGTQHRAGHRGAQLGIHAAHQHRLLAKRRGHPLAETGLRLMVCIPNQQIHGERKTETRTAEQGSVRSSRKRVLHLFLHQVGMVAGLIVLVRYLGETRIELVALGHAFRSAASCQQKP